MAAVVESTQKCNNCNNYECSWHVRFEPVPGWTAKPTKLNVGDGKFTDSYEIIDCPEFILNQRAKQKEEITRTAPCCMVCSSTTRNLCIAKNGTCLDFVRQADVRSSPLSHDKAIKYLVGKGHTNAEIAEMLDICTATVTRAKQRLDIVGRSKPVSGKAIEEEVQRLWEDGATVKFMATQLCCDMKTISAIKKRLNLVGNATPRKQYRVTGETGKRVAGTITECAKEFGVTVSILNRCQAGKSKRYKFTVEAV